MAEYTCKKKPCDGTVKFPDRSADPPDDLRGTRITVVDDKPVECPKCGTSWYESELK
jgi:hypothetical protein